MSSERDLTRLARLVVAVARESGPRELECSAVRVRRQGPLVYVAVRRDESQWSDEAAFDRTRIPTLSVDEVSVEAVQQAQLGSSAVSMTAQ